MPIAAGRSPALAPSLALVIEGGTSLLLPRTAESRGPARRAPVFYNPAMAFDRDLNVAVGRALRRSGRPPLDGWEMLGATGARGLRVAHESDLLRSLLITEREPEALAVIERNVQALGLPGVRVRSADARIPSPEGPFDYVDLDPYGSPRPFLGAAFGSVRLPAILAVTATDMMVLAGVVRGACEARYGARPLHGRLAPEGGVRILLAALARGARARGAGLRPLLSYVHDHHVRVYAQLVPDPESPGPDPVATIDPDRWDGPPLVGRGPFGPLWLGPLFDRDLVAHLRAPPSPARPREIERWIDRVRGEVEVDRPFFYEPNEVARSVGLAEPPPIEVLIERLHGSGAKAARAHPQASAFRTDAPRATVESVARAWSHETARRRSAP